MTGRRSSFEAAYSDICSTCEHLISPGQSVYRTDARRYAHAVEAECGEPEPYLGWEPADEQ